MGYLKPIISNTLFSVLFYPHSNFMGRLVGWVLSFSTLGFSSVLFSICCFCWIILFILYYLRGFYNSTASSKYLLIAYLISSTISYKIRMRMKMLSWIKPVLSLFSEKCILEYRKGGRGKANRKIKMVAKCSKC